MWRKKILIGFDIDPLTSAICMHLVYQARLSLTSFWRVRDGLAIQLS